MIIAMQYVATVMRYIKRDNFPLFYFKYTLFNKNNLSLYHKLKNNEYLKIRSKSISFY